MKRGWRMEAQWVTACVWMWAWSGASSAIADDESAWNEPQQALLQARSVADRYIALHPARKEGWNWEEAMFLHGLSELRKADPEAKRRFRPYVQAYHLAWARRGIPSIDRSDRCASGLSALSLMQDDGDWSGFDGAWAVAQYVKHEPRNRLGALNHVGHSWLNLIYPRSIWVDSLMMYGVFAARWASFSGDRALLDFAAAQIPVFAAKLQDPRTGLFRHAWLTNFRASVPAERAFWLRGNGWVLAAGVQILDELPHDHPQRHRIVGILERAARGLAHYQGADGLWDSIANDPGFSYRETSGAALVAYGIARGIKQGWMPRDLLPTAVRAYRAVSRRLIRTDIGLSMPGISGPTNALPKFFYSLVPQKRDLGYGVGAYLLASVAIAELN